MAIFVLAILLSLVVSMVSAVRVDLKASRNYAEGIQDNALLDGALARARVVLQNDTDTGQDTLDDDWATFGDNGKVEFALGDGRYQIEILDAGARLNLNTASRESLLLLPGVTDELADSLIDWRDADDTPGASGAESDVYQGYPRPYLAKNAPLDTVDELLMIQGFTPDLVFGDPTQPTQDETTGATVTQGLADLVTVRSYEANRTATGTERLNLSQVTEPQLQALTDLSLTQPQTQAIVAHRGTTPFRSVADLLDVRLIVQNGGNQNGGGRGGNQGGNQGGGTTLGGIAMTREQVRRMIDLFTVSSAKTLEGRINVNTAPLTVLETLPAMTEEAANKILTNRPFETVGDLLDESVMNEAQFRQIVNLVSTKSSVFLVRIKATAHPGGRVRAMEALVERTDTGVKLLRRHEVGRWPGWQSWGWTETPNAASNTTTTTTTTP